MEKQTFEAYAKIKHQIKELTAEAKELEQEILPDMIEGGIDKVKTEFGGFTIVNRKTWTYSEKVAELSEEVKAQKKKEEEDGTAKAEEKKSLLFR